MVRIFVRINFQRATTLTDIFVIHPENPQLRLIRGAVDALKKGKVIVYPTDSEYAMGCQIGNKAAEEQIRKRVIGVHGTRGVRPKVIGACKIKGGIDADVAGHPFEIEAELQVVPTLDPGEIAGNGLELVGSVEGPAAVETVAGSVRNALPLGFGAEA